MTVAPRIEVFTQLSCNQLHGHHEYNHTEAFAPFQTTNVTYHNAAAPFYFSLDPLGPHIHPYHFNPTKYQAFVVPLLPLKVPDWSNSGGDEEEDPRRLPSPQCLGNPTVQAGAARLQTIMITTMGLLSALTTGWWGHFGERHGRTKVLAISTFGLFLT
jgi:hypothetical protein